MTSNAPIERINFGIVRPSPGPRRGALRTVTIQPVPLNPLSLHQEAIAVQGVLPLGLGAADDPGRTWPPDRRAARSRRAPVPEVSDAALTQIAQQICRGMAEVLSGDRPANQLVRCTSERVYTDIARRSASAKSRRRMTQQRSAHVRVERVRTQRANPRAVEVCARLRRGGRVHALAARLEFVSGRWTCVALEDDLRL